MKKQHDISACVYGALRTYFDDLDGEKPGDDALDIAIDDGFGAVESDGGNGGRGIGADAGQRLQFLRRTGELAALFRYDPGSLVQVARA